MKDYQKLSMEQKAGVKLDKEIKLTLTQGKEDDFRSSRTSRTEVERELYC